VSTVPPGSDVDPHWFFADPDPAFFLCADPDPIQIQAKIHAKKMLPLNQRNCFKFVVFIRILSFCTVVYHSVFKHFT